MSAYQTPQALAGLRAVLERVRRDKERFLDTPLSAVGLFLEGHGRTDRFDLNDPDAVARFLGVPAMQVWPVQGVQLALRDTTHNGPYFAYRPNTPDDDPALARREARRQLEALGRYLPDLDALTRQLPPRVHRLLPDDPSGWWATLFHLAIHHPRPLLLEASRERWVNVTAPAPGVGPISAVLRRYPHESRVAESHLQFGQMQAPCVDIIPGVIWSRLIGDVFTATAAAVELLIGWLERPPAPPPDWPAVREQFRRLHAGFTALAERDRRWPRPLAGQPEPPVHLRPWSEVRLVKVTSSFRMPPAREWCDFPMEFEFQSMPLARHHADAEFLFSRHLSADFVALAEQAGAALPPMALDAPVLFSRPAPEERLPPGVVAGWSVGCSGLDPNPVARWVRFVCNTLRGIEPTRGMVEVRLLDPPAPTTFPDLYGYATLPGGLYAASARAIEVAALLPTPHNPPSVPAADGGSAGPTIRPAEDILAAATAERAHTERGRSAGAERERLWGEFVAALNPLRAEWFAAWRAAVTDGAGGVVATLTQAAGTLNEMQRLATVWLATAGEWRRAAQAHDSGWQLLAPDDGTLAGWGNALERTGGPLGIPARMPSAQVADHDARRGIELLQFLAAGGAARLGELFHLWGGVGFLRGLTGALAAAVIPPASDYEFQPCELPADDGQRATVGVVLGCAENVVGMGCLAAARRIITLPPPTVANLPSDPSAVEPAPAGAVAAPEPDGPFETDGRFGLRVGGVEKPFLTKEQQSFRIIRHMWPPTERREFGAVEVKRAIGSAAKNPKWPTNEASKARDVLGRCGVPFTIEADNGSAVFWWQAIHTGISEVADQNADGDCFGN